MVLYTFLFHPLAHVQLSIPAQKVQIFIMAAGYGLKPHCSEVFCESRKDTICLALSIQFTFNFLKTFEK